MSVSIIDADVPSPNDAYAVDFDLDFNLDVNLSLSDSILNENFPTTAAAATTTICDSTFNAEYFSDSSNTTSPVTSDLIWNALEFEQFNFKNIENNIISPELTSDLFIYQTDDTVISELKQHDYSAETLNENCSYDILKDSLFELDLFGETLKDIDDGIPPLLEPETLNPPIIDWNRRRSLLYDKNEFIRTTPDTRSQRKHLESKTKNLCLNTVAPVTSNKTVVEEQRSYRCSVRDCEKTYCKASHLKSHMRRHSGFKPFACDWEGCKWRFSRSDELARHKRSHSGIKPYSCDLCDKAFSRSDHLSKHSKVHMKKLALYGTPIITKKCNYKYLNTNRIKVE